MTPSLIRRVPVLDTRPAHVQRAEAVEECRRAHRAGASVADLVAASGRELTLVRRALGVTR